MKVRMANRVVLVLVAGALSLAGTSNLARAQDAQAQDQKKQKQDQNVFTTAF